MNIVLSTKENYFSQDQYNQLHQLSEHFGSRFFVQTGEDNLTCAIGEIDYLIHTDAFKNHDLDEFKRLKQLQILSAGTDRLDMPRLKEKNIGIYNAKDVYSVPIAEFTLMRILEIYKSARYFEALQKDKKTTKKRDLVELFGKTCAIYGYGSIGREIAKRLNAFGVKTIGVSRSGKKDEFIDKVLNLIESKPYVNEFDIVVSCLPQTEETRAFFNQAYFADMKKNAVFVNISRGGVVDEKALMDAIKSEKLLGVALDVFEIEPLPQESALWGFANAYLSPHNSFASTIMYDRLFERIFKNLEIYLKENVL